jgi:hypothetical protein
MARDHADLMAIRKWLRSVNMQIEVGGLELRSRSSLVTKRANNIHRTHRVRISTHILSSASTHRSVDLYDTYRCQFDMEILRIKERIMTRLIACVSRS